MKRIPFILLLLVVCFGLMPLALVADELTGIYHKEKDKNPSYLTIDGVGFIERIVVTGDVLKQLPDGSRVWIEGDIKTWLTGKSESGSLQQQPTQWRIVFVVSKWKAISKPFEKPKA